MKKYFTKLLLVFFVMITMCGCSILSNITRNIMGNSISVLKRDRPNAKSRVFDCEIRTCFKKIVAILDFGIIDNQILALDKRNFTILVLVSRPTEEKSDDIPFNISNTDVGIFLTQESPGRTKVEISSLSSLFAEYTSDKIFQELQPTLPQTAQLEQSMPEPAAEPEQEAE
ncbi:MAG: hypothetical protein PHS93_00420 [Candidatus Omnitrophica bacterium]|nr:hypothetical protein [Candidatus Omnitrophota bacterium]MDD5351619.1 hypothetical protein [Candidatus Omnitrophota bacterium]MDD5550829.1 hypothetical protein [Candidatus Omnitrophota bacterium]